MVAQSQNRNPSLSSPKSNCVVRGPESTHPGHGRPPRSSEQALMALTQESRGAATFVPHDFARIVGISSLIGFALVAIGVGTEVAISGGGGVASIACGMQVGGFSGAPFGAMLGCMGYFARHADH